MSIIFFRFFLLFSVVANMAGPKTRYHRACSRSLTSLVLSRSLRFAAKILYEIMLVRIFCNFSFFFTRFFWLMGWVWELFWRFLRFQLLFSRIFSGFWAGFESSPNLCVNSSSSYISPSMLPLSSGDLIEWSLVCHSILSYQKFCD